MSVQMYLGFINWINSFFKFKSYSPFLIRSGVKCYNRRASVSVGDPGCGDTRRRHRYR